MLKKRSLVIAGHATSVALEPEFWQVLEQAAETRGATLPELIAEIDASRDGSLSSALRVFALKAASSQDDLS